jgi:hypothetical protein
LYPVLLPLYAVQNQLLLLSLTLQNYALHNGIRMECYVKVFQGSSETIKMQILQIKKHA